MVNGGSTINKSNSAPQRSNSSGGVPSNFQNNQQMDNIGGLGGSSSMTDMGLDIFSPISSEQSSTIPLSGQNNQQANGIQQASTPINNLQQPSTPNNLFDEQMQQQHQQYMRSSSVASNQQHMMNQNNMNSMGGSGSVGLMNNSYDNNESNLLPLSPSNFPQGSPSGANNNGNGMILNGRPNSNGARPSQNNILNMYPPPGTPNLQRPSPMNHPSMGNGGGCITPHMIHTGGGPMIPSTPHSEMMSPQHPGLNMGMTQGIGMSSMMQSHHPGLHGGGNGPNIGSIPPSPGSGMMPQQGGPGPMIPNHHLGQMGIPPVVMMHPHHNMMGGGGPPGGRVYPPNQAMVFNPANPNAPPIYPCGVCHKEIHDNDQAILCESGCNFWFHRTCTGLTDLAYLLLTKEVYAEWVCDKCLATSNIPLVKIKS